MNRAAAGQRVTRSRSRSPAIRRGTPKAANTRSSGSKRQGCKLTTYYLMAYNAVSALAWAYFAYRFISSWPKGGLLSAETPFESTIWLLGAVQSMALLEVVHAALRLVPSPVLPTSVQIVSRLFVALVLGYYLRAGEHWGYLLLSVAWTLSDFTRYIYYLMNLMGRRPQLLVWARYSLFLVLYPAGTIGEMALIRNGSLFLAQLGSPMRYALLGLLAVYPVGFAFMYMHMLKQRAKNLAIK